MRPEWVRAGGRKPEYTGSDLLDFATWYGVHGPAYPMSPVDGLRREGDFPGLTLYRSGQFQVQLFILPAGVTVPPHRHPNVDTIEMHLSGDYDFRVMGVSAIPLDHLHDRRGDVSRWWGRGVRVRPTDWHDLEVFEAGAAFLSLQHWLNGSPTSVVLDWEGQPANTKHAAALQEK